MKATDLLVRALENEKVKYIFGVPGMKCWLKCAFERRPSSTPDLLHALLP